MSTSIISSIVGIKADAQVSVTEDDINQITWHDDNPTNITNEQILAKQVELKTDHVANKYQRDRTEKPLAGGYPSIGDQMDMIYHDQVDDTTTFKDAIQAVKDANPKP